MPPQGRQRSGRWLVEYVVLGAAAVAIGLLFGQTLITVRATES